MHRRQPLPRLWLMTDERQGDDLWRALERLPRGSGVVFRHYALPPAERRLLFERVRRVAARRRLVLLVAGDARLARPWRSVGCHGPGGRKPCSLHSMAVHDLRELVAARRAGTDLVFLSPVGATRSHPGQAPLGRVRFGLIARQAGQPVIALGGLGARSGRAMRALGAYGWGAIDAWSGPDQKRKAVPI